jgi:mRNA interferase RelE/StbE
MTPARQWRVEFDGSAACELRKLGHAAQQLILRYLRERIATADDPRRFGRPLTHDLKGLWRYRVGDYRIVAAIEDDRFIVLVLTVGHRREVYDRRFPAESIITYSDSSARRRLRAEPR